MDIGPLDKYLALPFSMRWAIADELGDMLSEREEAGEDPSGALSGRPKRTRR